jgi:outer membrane protein assembly factor BamA
MSQAVMSIGFNGQEIGLMTKHKFYVSMAKVILSISLSLLMGVSLIAQDKRTLKDSLDGAFDLSDWVLTAHGFIPVPMLITEPALGGFGGALMAVFITRNAPYVDTVDGKPVKQRVKPNVYGLGGAYTANGTWLTAGASMGVIRKWRAYYRLAGGYANVNLNFYKTLLTAGDQAFLFTIKTVPLYGQLIKQIGRSHWYIGANYLFLQSQIERGDPVFYQGKEISSRVGRLSMLVEYDSRDNIFTPDKGFLLNTQVGAAGQPIGSDYDYQMINSAAFYYVPLSHKLIAGFRAEYQQVWNDVPFYLKPFISLRGIPVARYQGNITTLVETEWRWDFVPRWSGLVFSGAGKAFQGWTDFSDARWHGSVGVGGRYLMARKLKLRMGVDVARGPEQWAYYIVFGTSWVR